MAPHYNIESDLSSRSLKRITPKPHEDSLEKLKRILEELIELTNEFSSAVKSPPPKKWSIWYSFNNRNQFDLLRPYANIWESDPGS